MSWIGVCVIKTENLKIYMYTFKNIYVSVKSYSYQSMLNFVAES